MEKQNPYLYAGRMVKATVLRILLTVIGGLLTAFFGFGLVLTFTDETMRQDWWVAVVMLVPSVWMLGKGIAVGRELALARRYQSIFSFDENGTVTLEELIKQSGRGGAQISAELEKLFRKGYFRGCSLRRAPLSVMLTGTEKSGEHYVSVVCPHCGGTTRLRAGSSGKCDYCDSAIETK